MRRHMQIAQPESAKRVDFSHLMASAANESGDYSPAQQVALSGSM